MTRAHRHVSLALATGILFGAFATWNRSSLGQAPGRAVTIWEYKTWRANVGSEELDLNGLGRDGWELVGVRPYGNNLGDLTVYILKRAKR
jgi:hypothetical protein